jgi:hypothetical protein
VPPIVLLVVSSGRITYGYRRKVYLQSLLPHLTPKHNPKQKSKLKTNSDPIPNAANPPIDAGTTIDPNIDLNIDPNIDPNLSSNTDPNLDAIEPNRGGRAPSITLSEFSDAFDDRTPFEPLCRQRPSVQVCSWVFNWFEVVILHNELYTPKGAIGQKTDRRLNCKLASCNWFVKDSKRGGSIGK